MRVVSAGRASVSGKNGANFLACVTDGSPYMIKSAPDNHERATEAMNEI